MRKRNHWRIILSALSLLLLFLFMPAAIFADSPASSSSLYIQYEHPNTELHLYHVGQYDGKTITWNDDCKAYSLHTTPSSQEEWRMLAGTLDTCLQTDSKEPTHKKAVPESGRLSFEGITPGLYLVRGPNYVHGSETYRPTPTLVHVPDNQSVEAAIKYETAFVSEEETINIEKVWQTSTGSKLKESEHPKEVTIALYQNKTKVESRKLNKQNQWKTAWQIEAGTLSSISIREENIPEGYELLTSQDGSIFTIINRKKADDPNKPNTNTSISSSKTSSTYKPSQKTSTSTSKSAKTNSTKNTDNTKQNTSTSKKPNTAQILNPLLWALMAILSILLFVLLKTDHKEGSR